ncbi:MAG: DUF2157 domain-containing protein [Paucibacter sp.]|nr:DUF2157 domain-containing protein [Roseateles sp.]
MTSRLELFQLSARYGLDAQAAAQLHRLAGLHQQPADLPQRVLRGTALLAAGLAGLGLLMWLAANWGEWGRAARFGLLQFLLLASALGAALLPQVRTALALFCLLSLGGLLAFFGQTYQTGADSWQLFALWAALGLPLALGARSDLLWAFWAVIVMLAIGLWMQTHLAGRWVAQTTGLSADLAVQALALGLAALLLLLLSPLSRRWTGAGTIALRSAMAMTSAFATAVALSGLFHASTGPQFWLGLCFLLLAAAPLTLSPRHFDLSLLSMLALGMNILLVFSFAQALSPSIGPLSGDPFKLLLTGVAAALLMAASVSALMRLKRRRLLTEPAHEA